MRIIKRSRFLPLDHLGRQVCLFFDNLQSEFRAFVNFETNNLLHLHQLPLFQICNDLWIWICTCLLYDLQLFSSSILYRVRLRMSNCVFHNEPSNELTDATSRPSFPLEIHLDLKAFPCPTFATFLSPIAVSS